MNHFAVQAEKTYLPDPNDNIMDSMFKQYERVIVESIITSFGLDMLIGDQHGGDVDTILNVRKIDTDPNMKFKNRANQIAYESRGAYDSHEYHSHPSYKQKNKEVSELKKSGSLSDTYTGKKIAPNERSDLDHTISAKEIHDDAGRILAGLNGADLANSPENLNATNPHTNRTKKALTTDEFLARYGNEYTEEDKARMRQVDQDSRKSYEQKVAHAYYSSPKFMADTAKAAGKVAGQMALRQAFGLIFTEIWFAVKEKFERQSQPFDFGKLIASIGDGIKLGIERAKNKYKEIVSKVVEGAAAGALSSLTTTLCNIFFTTAKNVVHLIRQAYASLVEAAKVLFINPDNYAFGDRMKAVTKILATGASVILGTVVTEAIEKTPIGAIPVVGNIVSTFCGSMVSGILTCSFLYFMDRSEMMNKLVSSLNSFSTIEDDINYFRKQAEYFDRYAAELMHIDLAQFKKEVAKYETIALKLENCSSEQELNSVLKSELKALGIKLPWQGDFSTFMSNRSNTLVFD